MPRTRSLAWSELKVGLLTIVALAIAALLIFSLMGAKGFFWQRYPLKSRFANVAGLAAGSPVRVAGVVVGSVTDVQFVGEQVDVIFEVHREHRSRITDRSSAYLGSVSLLGTSAVDMVPSTEGTPIPDWGYVPQGRGKGQFADIAAQATEGVEEVTELLKDARAGRGSVGKLLTDDRLFTDLRQFIGTANDVTEAIKGGKGTIGRLVNDRKTADALDASLTELREMTRRINAGEGSLGRLVKDEAFAQSLTAATANLRDLTARLNLGEGTAGKLMTDASLFNRLNAVTEKLDDLVTKLSTGEGTLGQLLKDRQLYENMNKTVGEFQSLLAEIKKDPKRYLNVKVSIW
jgi:phospholipid/cholesterol/gamma-HCH transport system substrate-binding protein